VCLWMAHRFPRPGIRIEQYYSAFQGSHQTSVAVRRHRSHVLADGNGMEVPVGRTVFMYFALEYIHPKKAFSAGIPYGSFAQQAAMCGQYFHILQSSV
jgi:hypothetical protein